MSTDVLLGHPCPHLVVEEVVSLAPDRRLLPTRCPVASDASVRVLANDGYVPSAGLYSQAQLTGEHGGPYTVTACDADLTVTTGTEVGSVTLPTGVNTPVSVARALTRVLAGVAVEVVNETLVLTDTASVGPSSSLRVSGGAATVLGFRTQRGAAGRTLYPGWTNVLGVDGRRPQFNTPVMGNPVWKVTYPTYPTRCVRCGGTRVENDARFDSGGDTLMVEGANLLYQAALKIILTRVQSNPYYPAYGSALSTRVGAKAVGATATLLTEDVSRALGIMQSLQAQQSKFQVVSRDERLYTVASVKVTPNPVEATAFNVSVVLVSASNQSVEVSIVFTVPGVVALAGGNGQTLGLEPTGVSPTASLPSFFQS